MEARRPKFPEDREDSDCEVVQISSMVARLQDMSIMYDIFLCRAQVQIVSRHDVMTTIASSSARVRVNSRHLGTRWVRDAYGLGEHLRRRVAGRLAAPRTRVRQFLLVSLATCFHTPRYKVPIFHCEGTAQPASSKCRAKPIKRVMICF